MSILVVAEHEAGKIKSTTLSVITAAQQLKSEIHLIIAGDGALTIAREAAKIRAITKVRILSDPSCRHLLAEPLSAALASVARNYTHIMAAASSVGKNILPRLAASLDVQPISDVVAIESEDIFVRPIYSGSTLVKVQSSDRWKVITVRAANFPLTSAEGGFAEIEEIEGSFAFPATEYLSTDRSESKRPDLEIARVVIAGGRGMQSAENFRMLESLADKLNAAIGASRAAVDSGYISNDCQVGQTGKVVAPELYIAVGISGAIQHQAGMRDSKIIVAINKDPDAAIFQISDYVLVGDLFDIVPRLDRALGIILSRR